MPSDDSGSDSPVISSLGSPSTPMTSATAPKAVDAVAATPVKTAPAATQAGVAGGADGAVVAAAPKSEPSSVQWKSWFQGHKDWKVADGNVKKPTQNGGIQQESIPTVFNEINVDGDGAQKAQLEKVKQSLRLFQANVAKCSSNPFELSVEDYATDAFGNKLLQKGKQKLKQQVAKNANPVFGKLLENMVANVSVKCDQTVADQANAIVQELMTLNEDSLKQAIVRSFKDANSVITVVQKCIEKFKNLKPEDNISDEERKQTAAVLSALGVHLCGQGKPNDLGLIAEAIESGNNEAAKAKLTEMKQAETAAAAVKLKQQQDAAAAQAQRLKRQAEAAAASNSSALSAASQHQAVDTSSSAQPAPAGASLNSSAQPAPKASSPIAAQQLAAKFKKHKAVLSMLKEQQDKPDDLWTNTQEELYTASDVNAEGVSAKLQKSIQRVTNALNGDKSDLNYDAYSQLSQKSQALNADKLSKIKAKLPSSSSSTIAIDTTEDIKKLSRTHKKQLLQAMKAVEQELVQSAGNNAAADANGNGS
jgi:hypothetical protein